ncbi:hypothetical protein RclHR1_10710006 [Rhizophagus clarus]|uniref:Ricin B lectin domain-containing protein n=1 Tax=Rhizophagus clarus TaxID=94130 RepID=A0A2Z6Q2N1_9GLOM|nr:hypothetical protein RclHR1_10710006 [Rhizophagus clarus]GES74414.1 hypothetical protein GLOIN_2v1534693 [Rhizophagus clarus]
MKFNLILLLLTTLTAVVLSQNIPGQTIIQLFEHDFYWGLNGTEVVLHPGGIEAIRWTIVPYAEGNFINYNDKSVQYNGDFKPLTIENGTESLDQRWIIEPNNVPGIPSLICSSQVSGVCATAVDKDGEWVVIAAPRSFINPLQRWILYSL